MDVNSPLFDKIRIKPTKARGPGEARPAAEDANGSSAEGPACDHPGCKAVGAFRAPKGRGHEGEFYHFCLDHVRAYNQTYNYFAGMADDAVMAFQKDAAIGHRPTWAMGVNAWGPKGAQAASAGSAPPGAHPGARAGASAEDPFGLFGQARRAQRAAAPEPRRLKLAERRAFEALDLDEAATPDTIKTRYKALVKRLHPDANGGDRSSEDKLRGIIGAYKTLRSAGLC